MQPKDPNEIKTFRKLYYRFKTRLLTFLGNDAINIHSIEGGVLSVMIHIYPTHAIAIINIFTVYLFYKPTKPN